MRRLRSVDEMKRRAHLQRQIIQRRLNSSEAKELKTISPLSTENVKKQRALRRKNVKTQHLILEQPAPSINFIDFDKYKYTSRPLTICHVIENLGLGGAQTMMMELVKALNRYYGHCVRNLFIGLHEGDGIKCTHALYDSYGITPTLCLKQLLAQLCVQHHVDILVHHRISVSSDLSRLLPEHIKYVLINHTWNRMSYLKKFPSCDAYISVCDFLHQRSLWKSSKNAIFATILNGIENDYDDILPAQLEGDFKTGRCHRLAMGKFKKDSLPWLSSLTQVIPGFHHYLMGQPKKCDSLPGITCHGLIYDLRQKISLIKALDVYFYETFQPEGASIAVLESLGCGVPVLCRDEGGNSELVKNNINGFILNSRDDFRRKMIELNSNRTKLMELKTSTLLDFNARLHVRHAACKFMQIFEKMTNGQI